VLEPALLARVSAPARGEDGAADGVEAGRPSREGLVMKLFWIIVGCFAVYYLATDSHGATHLLHGGIGVIGAAFHSLATVLSSL
jgi:hypothetical protein